MDTRENRGLGGWIGAALVALALFTNAPAALAQEAAVMVSEPDRQPATPEQMRAMAEGRRAAAQANAQPNAQPPQESKPDDMTDQKQADTGEKKDDDEAAESVQRPEEPARAPDPREFDVALDEQGRVPPFNFIGQPWPDVMQWLANLSKSSLDWQELPSGHLNLTTQRSYTVDEARDLINRHLHARGFTSILAGEVLSVFRIAKLDPSLVPRVEEDELYDHKAYDYAKVSFDLPAGLEVEKAQEDVKQLLGPNARVFPLVTTRRLLVMDAVANLRTVSELLNQERMLQDGRIVPKEFVLRHARPEQVIETLYVILGVDPKAKPAQTDPKLQQQQLQVLQQMQQRGGGGADMAKLLAGPETPQVFLAFNRQRNSVLANAPPEQMKIIEQTIAYLDVPYGGGVSEPVGAAAATNNGQRQLKKYPLTTLDPETFVQTLAEIGGLSPFAEFSVDTKSKTLFALATDEDHLKLDSLVDQFDGTGRDFHVVWLRRLPADAVATTVFNLMAGQTEEEDDTSSRRSWSPWDYRGREEKKDKPIKGFGVDADIENNRLLLWANEVEMERVRGLLMKLGEIPSGQQDARPVRFIQPSSERPTAELLEQLRDVWSAAGGNELIINTPQQEPRTAPSDDEAEPDEEEAVTAPDNDRSASRQPPQRGVQYIQVGAVADQLAAEVAESADRSTAAEPNQEAAEAADEPPPVTITVTDDGRLMLSSPDSAALDQLEELIQQLTPPERRFRVFRLEHIQASHMYWDLRDYFEEDLKEEQSGFIRDYWGFRVPMGTQEQATGLSRRRKLMITYDVPSNSILVANASPSQLLEIEQLIEEFDRPVPTDSVEVRETAAIKINYSRPSLIAAAVKEVYRDLLSSRDKEFDSGDPREQRSNAERVTVINYGGTSTSGGSDRPSPAKVRFDGALSLGADDVSGILIVSAQKGIFDDIVRMVRELDAEAAPNTTVRVHHVNANVSAEALQKAVNDALTSPWIGNQPELPDTAASGDESSRSDRSRSRRSRN